MSIVCNEWAMAIAAMDAPSKTTPSAMESAPPGFEVKKLIPNPRIMDTAKEMGKATDIPATDIAPDRSMLARANMPPAAIPYAICLFPQICKLSSTERLLPNVPNVKARTIAHNSIPSAKSK